MIGNGGGGGSANIGGLTDMVGVPYTGPGSDSLLAYAITGYAHVHGQAFTYPKLADSVVLTSGAGAWGTGGSIIEVIPENSLNVADFDLHWINMINPDDAEFIIEFYGGNAGSEVLIGDVDTWADSSFFGGQQGVNAKRIQVPQQLKNTRIGCKLYSSNVGTAQLSVKFNGHYYS